MQLRDAINLAAHSTGERTFDPIWIMVRPQIKGHPWDQGWDLVWDRIRPRVITPIRESVDRDHE